MYAAAVAAVVVVGLRAQAQSNPDDDWMDYNNELRIGILEAYSGILQGLSRGAHCLLASTACSPARKVSCTAVCMHVVPAAAQQAFAAV